MSQILKSCQPTILLPGDNPDTNQYINIYLDLSKQSSGDGSFNDMFNWQGLLNFLANVDLGKQVRVWTIGSNHSLMNDQNRWVIKNLSFSATIGQRIEFISFRPYEYNIPFMGSGVSGLRTAPFIDMENVSGLTLIFSRFRIATQWYPFISMKDCDNVTLGITNCGISPSAINTEGASLIDIKDSVRLKVALLHNGIVDLSKARPVVETAILQETHSIFSNPTEAGILDAGNNFDSGRTFDSIIHDYNINRFYFDGNYISWKSGWYTFFKTDNYRSRVVRKNNKYRVED